MKYVYIILICGLIAGCDVGLNPVLAPKGVAIDNATVLIKLYPTYFFDSGFFYNASIVTNTATVMQIATNSNMVFGLDIYTEQPLSYPYNFSDLAYMLYIVDPSYTNTPCVQIQATKPVFEVDYYKLRLSQVSGVQLIYDLDFFFTNLSVGKQYQITAIAGDPVNPILMGYALIIVN